ncbi:MAG: hypothetical protein KatS3mg129_0050 [Leptospiraceae bacterium]|nr:MAG: hypothetical protein KatS3mg129_0050 [Leptospiraceae bacterium]
MKKKILILFLLIILVNVCKEKGKVIETIGKDNITTQEFETYYETYIEKASRLANAEKKTLYELMCNPDKVPQDPAIQELIAGLYPENSYQKFREMKIIEQAAISEGFDKKPVIKNILEQVLLETLVNLYMQEKMQEKIKVSTEQIEKRCEELRKKDRRFNTIPIDQCLKIAEASLKQEILRQEYPKIINEIKESIQVKKNAQFDKDKYLKEDIKLFKEAQKIGGCENQESSDTSKENQK